MRELAEAGEARPVEGQVAKPVKTVAEFFDDVVAVGPARPRLHDHHRRPGEGRPLRQDTSQMGTGTTCGNVVGVLVVDQEFAL